MTNPVARTGGVDLAAESARTALATVDWLSDRVRVVDVRVGVTDDEIVAAARGLDNLGIDCAFGWPDEFVAFVARHSDPTATHPPEESGIAWRRTLAYRETDRVVRERTGRWPLSVSTDRLGLTAMHCAGLLGRLGAAGFDIDRTGRSGLVAEVYPGATLRVWGWHLPGYRTDSAVRHSLVEHIARDAPWLDFGEHVAIMERSPDALDAVIAALGVRAATLGFFEPPPHRARSRAEREGWIVLPDRPLADFVDHAEV